MLTARKMKVGRTDMLSMTSAGMSRSTESFSGSSDKHLARWPWAVSFPMLKSVGTTVAWSNPHLVYEGGDDALIDAFAYQIPKEPPAEWPDASRKTFYAECYGGQGIHHNGGGVRVGWSGDWLVKGIGINLLSGYSDEDAAEYRKNGRAGLGEMLVEAIWGEVLHYALPYGAVRMTAILRTTEKLNDPIESTGGLGIRQFAWRPAHFMRAPAFHVRPENRALIPHDTARVKEAIARLPGLLPMPQRLTPAEIAKLKPLQRLKIGLEEMVRRFGEQMGAAKAKRLSHGTLSTSNVSLDGRWNDLNSISALPGYGYRRNMTPFWEDQNSLLTTIDLLCFYIKKYFPEISGEPPEAMPTKAWLTAAFGKFYQDALARRFVSLCGYPQNVLGRVWVTQHGRLAMHQLAATLIKLARSGYSPRRPFHDAMQENRVAGDYDLMKILKTLSICRNKRNRMSILEPLIKDRPLRACLDQQYGVVEEMMFKEARNQGLSTHGFARLIAINCDKAGRNIPFLFRNVIFEKCQQLAELPTSPEDARAEIARTIQSVIDEARTIYQEPRNFRTLLWCAGQSTLAYDARSDELIMDIAGEETRLSCLPASWNVGSDAEIANLLASMRSYWGERYEEVMQ
jgi:hypothetical protein